MSRSSFMAVFEKGTALAFCFTREWNQQKKQVMCAGYEIQRQPLTYGGVMENTNFLTTKE